MHLKNRLLLSHNLQPQNNDGTEVLNNQHDDLYIQNEDSARLIQIQGNSSKRQAETIGVSNKQTKRTGTSNALPTSNQRNTINGSKFDKLIKKSKAS